jgi:hypothetical protein
LPKFTCPVKATAATTEEGSATAMEEEGEEEEEDVSPRRSKRPRTVQNYKTLQL